MNTPLTELQGLYNNLISCAMIPLPLCGRYRRLSSENKLNRRVKLFSQCVIAVLNFVEEVRGLHSRLVDNALKTYRRSGGLKGKVPIQLTTKSGSSSRYFKIHNR